MLRTVVQQYLGEASGRGTDVDAAPARHTQAHRPEHLERPHELARRAADPHRSRVADADLVTGAHRQGRLAR